MPKSRRKLGAPPTFDPEEFDAVLLQLFQSHGRLNRRNLTWNCAARAVEALAEEYQEQHEHSRVPGDTWLKKHVREFLIRHPHLDLEEPRRRKD
jgi:hypothetical protein